MSVIDDIIAKIPLSKGMICTADFKWSERELAKREIVDMLNELKKELG